MQEIIDNNFDRLPTRQSYGILDVLPASPAKKNSIEVKMTADLIQQPQIWQLLMEASSDRLAAVAFSPYENHSMIFEELAYKSGDGDLRGLENTVYNNSLLLADFSKVTLLYDTLRVLPVPEADDSLACSIFRSVYPSQERPGSNVVVNHIPELDLAICSEIPGDVENFLRRTFPCMNIEHPLVPLCRYFSAKHPVRRSGKTLVNLRGKRLDIITLGDRAPLTVGSYRMEEPMDAVYYILASRESLRLPETDEIMIAGDRATRAAITPILRRYVRYVMPAIFPSAMFRAGKASLSAPFELIVSPLVPPAKPIDEYHTKKTETCE